MVGALSSSKQSNGPNILDPLEFIVAIEETLLCIEEADIVGSAAFPDSHWHVRPIAMAKHSLQTILGGGGGGGGGRGEGWSILSRGTELNI